MKKLSCVFGLLSIILASDVTFNEGAIKGFSTSPNPGKIDLSIGMMNHSMNPYIDFDYYGNDGAGIEFQSTFGENLSFSGGVSTFGENSSFSGGVYYIWNDISSDVDLKKYLFSIQKIKTSSGLKKYDTIEDDEDENSVVIYLANSMEVIISENLYLSNQLYMDSNKLLNFGSRVVCNINSLISTGFQFDYFKSPITQPSLPSSEPVVKSTFLSSMVGFSLLDNQSFGYIEFDEINIFGSYSHNLKSETTNKDNLQSTLALGLSIFFK